MRQLPRLLIVVAIVAAAGCSGGSAEDSPESVVRRYVEALDRGAFNEAMSHRCSAAQVDSTEEDQFMSEVDRLKTEAGGNLRVAEIDEVRPVRLADMAGSLADHEFRVRLRTGESTSGALAIATSTEGGQPLVCGFGVEESFAIQRQLSRSEVEHVAASVADVRALATDAALALGVDVVEEGASKGAGERGVEGWSSAWRSGSFGGGRITVVRYASPIDATQRAMDVLGMTAPDSYELFDSPATNSAIGLRFRPLAWTGVQPANLGPQADLAVVVYDDVLVWMSVSGLDSTSDHTEINRVVGAIAKLMKAQ